MPDISTNLEDYTCWIKGKRLPSLIDLTLPKLSSVKVEFKGAGHLGSTNYNAKGRFESMTVGLNFQTFREECAQLLSQDGGSLDCRAGIQHKKGGGSGLYVVPEQILIEWLPQEFDLGKWTVGEKQEVPVQLEVTAIQVIWNKKKVIHVDKERYICIINGVDEVADTRAAIGLS